MDPHESPPTPRISLRRTAVTGSSWTSPCWWSKRFARWSVECEKTRQACAEDLLRREQAQDQERLAVEIVEVAGLYQHVFAAQQLERPLFLAANARRLQDGVPTALDIE